MLFTLSCKKGDSIIDNFNCTVTAVHGKKDYIIGKWKLVMENYAFHQPNIQDYSCHDIIYEFKPNGSLLITGNVENNFGIIPGSYEFKLISEPLYEWLVEKQTLHIGGDRDWACGISHYKMILNDGPLDGPKLTFYRIQ